MLVPCSSRHTFSSVPMEERMNGPALPMQATRLDEQDPSKNRSGIHPVSTRSCRAWPWCPVSRPVRCAARCLPERGRPARVRRPVSRASLFHWICTSSRQPPGRAPPVPRQLPNDPGPCPWTVTRMRMTDIPGTSGAYRKSELGDVGDASVRSGETARSAGSPAVPPTNETKERPASPDQRPDGEARTHGRWRWRWRRRLPRRTVPFSASARAAAEAPLLRATDAARRRGDAAAGEATAARIPRPVIDWLSVAANERRQCICWRSVARPVTRAVTWPALGVPSSALRPSTPVVAGGMDEFGMGDRTSRRAHPRPSFEPEVPAVPASGV